MATNRDLLKEAIADAKAVKEMAIANAKAALEESFTPQLKSMLSAKLQEMEEEEEELDEAGFGPMINVKGHGNIEDESSLYEMEEEEEEELDLDELLNELNEEEEEEEESEEDETESEEEAEPLDLENMTDEDLKKMIEDVIADMMESGELELEKGEEEEMEMEPESEEEEIDLDELLAEISTLDEEEEEMEDESMMYEEEEEELDEIFGFGKPGAGGSKFVKDFINTNQSKISDIKAIEDKTARLEAAKPIITQFFNSNVRKMDPNALRSDISVLRTELGVGELGGGSKSTVSIAELKAKLDEAYTTIETLRGDLNEVNLLNAKLLYTNKIFKSKNLTESQKVNVLSMFDKATNVGEVKLVFETLSEGLKAKSTPIKENLGSASKTTGTTKTKQPIVESNDMVARFQKLAGIIKD